MTLGQQQELFMQLLPRLIDEVHRRSWKCRGGELWRTAEQALLYAKQGRGIAQSRHQVKCAIDLNLFIDGKYIEDDTGHRELGAFWESLHPNCRSGAFYKPPTKLDPNHYELLANPRT